ncbi:MAG: hypothetical protein K1X74_12515 [Pirellulales bacterium]|nr:hypothetical protein [Pirellulales bacterium]
MNALPLLPLVLDRVPDALPQVLAQEGIATVDAQSGHDLGRFVLYDSRAVSVPCCGNGQTPIDVDPLRAEFAEDPFAALCDENTVRGSWAVGGLELTEEIARVDKRLVARRIAAWLRERVEAAGGVWLRLAAFPFPYRSAFNFRVDHDDYDPADFRTTLHALGGYEQAASHFVCAADFERFPYALQSLRGCDVGAHGYRHHTYRERDLNVQNIRRGIDVLLRAGLKVSGFVAPHGRFNPGLLAALESLGITHSSEFGLAYDAFPYFPGGRSVLQIPVHPVCLGLFLEAANRAPQDAGTAISPAAAADLAAAYFERVARARYLAGEPIFFYGHPTGRLGRYPHVLRRLLQTVDEMASVWPTTLTDFAAWWRQRGRVRLSAWACEDGLRVTCESRPADYRLSGELWRGELVARVPLDESELLLPWDALVFERRARDATPRPLRLDRREGLRGWLRRALDWERETPIDEIDTTSLRGWMKKTLRRVRS